MKAVIYNIATGKIDRVVEMPPAFISIQCQSGEEFYLNCPDSATHIINDLPVTIASMRTNQELLAGIRQQRGQRLSVCDWTQTLDAPLTQEKKVEWATYRQALRDFPDTCDIENPVWPVAPN
jgi:hypothetical protein